MSRIEICKEFGGVPILATTRQSAVEAVLAAAKNNPTTFRLVNAGTLDSAAGSQTYTDLLKGPGVNFPDGKPLAAILNRSKPRSIPCEQVRGPWLFEECINTGRAQNIKHYLLGSTPNTLKLLSDQLESRFSGVDIVGSFSPPFEPPSDIERREQDREITDSGADIVWVALGTPKQDAEALRILQATGITTVAVGAAFDFTAKTKRQAPKWLRTVHLEWLFRLIEEPKRLWRRYLIGNARFIFTALRHLVRSRI